MKINTKLSYKGCWKMVNAIQHGRSAEEVRGRCQIAEAWLMKNEVISTEQFDDLMMAVSYIYRESFHPEYFS